MDWKVAIIGAGLLAIAVLLAIASVSAERKKAERKRVVFMGFAYAFAAAGLPVLIGGLLIAANGAAS